MTQKWGREEYAGEWPSGKAVWTIGALCVALVAAGAISAYRYARVWTSLVQRSLREEDVEIHLGRDSRTSSMGTVRPALASAIPSSIAARVA